MWKDSGLMKMQANGGMAILEKAGAVVSALEALGEATVQDIADWVGEPVSSTYRLLGTLAAIGWVDPGSHRGLHRLGLKVLRIGGLLEERLDVRRACQPVLEQLREATHATSFLCFRRGDLAVCIERIAGRDVQTLGMRLGDAYELYFGAAPNAILAFLPDEEQEAVLARLAEKRELGEAVPPERELRSRIAATRARGYAIADEDVTPGVAAIGAPVYNHRGELEGSISVSGLRDRILVASGGVSEAVVDAAARASRALGFVSQEVAA